LYGHEIGSDTSRLLDIADFSENTKSVAGDVDDEKISTAWSGASLKVFH
jgi:hypothetical protein